MRLRVATFNVENLSSRWRPDDLQRGDAAAALALADIQDQEQRAAAQLSVALAQEDDKRQMTALAIAETGADILCLQEVDNLRSLEAFFSKYVNRISDIRYGHFALKEGNDRRGIDVAFAARRSLVPEGTPRLTSHAEATFAELDVFDQNLEVFGITPQDRVFTRDCLQVELAIEGRQLTLFLCHFRSMDNAGRDDGRESTIPLRRAEAQAVRRIVERRFGADWPQAAWIVAGDLNDYTAAIEPGGRAVPGQPSGIDPLLDDFAVNPVEALPPHERWTYFHRAWSSGRARLVEQHVQLDYVLLSPALADGARAEIVRRGLPYRAPLDPRDPDRSIARLATTCDRYPRVGWDRPKASDHCPLIVEFEF
jgi:endonuclease/exonuclease/phosphatase family metal-dependent hydrolase